MSVFRMTTQRPVAISMVVLAVIVFGLVSYRQLALTLMPRMNFPSITIRTEYPGAAPEEVEQNVTRRIEEAVSVAGGLTTMVSGSRAESSSIVLSFDWDTDINIAIQDVREKLDQVFLPEDAERPLILRYDPNLEPVVRMALSSSGNHDLNQLRTYAEEELRFSLDRISGVAAVKIRGGMEEEILVELDNHQLALLGLDVTVVADRLAAENINLSGGILKQGTTEYLARTLSEFKSLREMGDLIVTVENERPVFLRDIANIRYGHRDRDMIAHVTAPGGTPQEAVLLDFYKEAEANIVQVAHNILDLTLPAPKTEPSPPKDGAKTKASQPKTLAETLPEGMTLTLLSNQARFIESAVNEVKSTAVQGGILAVIVLLLFLGKTKPTLIVGAAIPLSIVGTFAPLKLQGVSLNIMSLGGLALGVGMLVDNAIVVLESITRCQEEGDPPMEACVRGVTEVGTAVISSTLTTIAVFFPLVFVEGIAGELFGDLALAVVFSLIVSLLVALFVIPMLASQGADLSTESVRRGPKALAPKWYVMDPWRRETSANPLIKFAALPFKALESLLLLVFYLVWWVLFIAGALAFAVAALIFLVLKTALLMINKTLGFVVHHTLTWITNFYRAALAWSLGTGRVLIWLLIFATGALLYLGFGRLDTELIPQMHQGRFELQMELPIGGTVEHTAEELNQLEQQIAAMPGVARVFSTFGADRNEVNNQDDGPQTAKINVVLESPKDNTDITQMEEALMTQVRDLAVTVPDADATLALPSLFSFSTPVEVHLQDYSLDKLAQVTPVAVERLKKVPGLRDIGSSLRRGQPEVLIHFDREKLAYYNFTVKDISERLRKLVQGDVPTRYSRGDKRIDIRVRLLSDQREHVRDLGDIIINPEADQPIPLNALAQFTLINGPSEIRRVDQKRSALIHAGVEGAGLGSITRDIEAQLADLDVTFQIAGQSLEFENSKASLILAVLLSIFLVYVVMASQFESVIHPFVILFSIPLAFFGVVAVLWQLDMKLSVLVFLGMILLAGIVVNNAIVLVDYINLLRSRGHDLRQAVIEAGAVRLRPILMTTCTTVLGLLPMAMGMGEGGELRRPLAVTVISGLSFSTVLTLLVIPVIYYTVEGLRQKATHAQATVAPSPNE